VMNLDVSDQTALEDAVGGSDVVVRYAPALATR
jgi:hypothetical protein